MHPRGWALLPALAALTLAACGSPSHHAPVPHPSPVEAAISAPQSTHPPIAVEKATVRTPHPRAVVVVPRASTASFRRVVRRPVRYSPVVVLHQIADLSNNDPASYAQLAQMRRHGVAAVILKANQGTGFIDGTFVRMARAARQLGLVVCGYDFVSTYTAAEAYTFINTLRAAGIWSFTRHTCPPTLDVEYGNATRSGIQNMLQILWRSYHRAQTYTGNWYWSRLGCWWPYGVTGWLSGYPYAPVPCGLPLAHYLVHQYTDRGFNGAFSSDLSWFRGTISQWRTYVNAPATRPATKPAPKPVKTPHPPIKPRRACHIRALRLGDHGLDVLHLEQALRSHGARIKLDSKFRADDLRSVFAFQRHHHLAKRPVVGNRERRLLKLRVCA